MALDGFDQCAADAESARRSGDAQGRDAHQRGRFGQQRERGGRHHADHPLIRNCYQHDVPGTGQHVQPQPQRCRVLGVAELAEQRRDIHSIVGGRVADVYVHVQHRRSDDAGKGREVEWRRKNQRGHVFGEPS
jgi:hypothetical protein